MYIAFETKEIRDTVYDNILNKVQSDCATEKSLVECMHQWVYGKLTNFEYLMILNSAAYRSFADLSQYPIFPWILNEYKSDTIDLKDPKIYRDLSKPIGMLNPKRFKELKERFEIMPLEERFMYGTHYSTPAYVISFLVRKYPLLMIKLQSGHFDNPNRLFYSIHKEWKSVLENAGNVRELIPEFYMKDSSFLINTMGLSLGVKMNKKPVNVLL